MIENNNAKDSPSLRFRPSKFSRVFCSGKKVRNKIFGVMQQELRKWILDQNNQALNAAVRIVQQRLKNKLKKIPFNKFEPLDIVIIGFMDDPQMFDGLIFYRLPLRSELHLRILMLVEECASLDECFLRLNSIARPVDFPGLLSHMEDDHQYTGKYRMDIFGNFQNTNHEHIGQI